MISDSKRRYDELGFKDHLIDLESRLGTVEDFLDRHATKQSANGRTRQHVPAIPVVVALEGVKPERVKWLWPGRIPLGKLTIIDGDPGLGKSTLLLDLAARVTTGSPMPDGQPGVTGGVVILTAEDGLADTVRPRLDAAGADVKRVCALTALREGDNERFPTVGDIEAIGDAIASVGGVLVIIDPLMAYLGVRVKSHHDQDVRAALSGLGVLAEQTGAAIPCIRHLNKSDSRKPIYRGGGSIGIIGAARSGLLVAADPEDERRRILAVTKSNLAAPSPSLAFHLEADLHDRLRIAWEGSSSLTAKQLLAEPETDEERSALDDASTFLSEVLARGPVLSRDVKRDARDAGIAVRTLWRAKARLGVQARKVGDKWEWSLSDVGTVGTVGTLEENGAEYSDSPNSAMSANSANCAKAGVCPHCRVEPIAEGVARCGGCEARRRGWT